MPETLILLNLEAAYLQARNNKDFMYELGRLQRTYVGHPTPIGYAPPAGQANAWAARQIYLKRRAPPIPVRTKSTTRWARLC